MYDFDTVINRRGTGSLKWDVADNELPMWVADMDFATAPEIIEAVKAKAEYGVWGYSIVPETWYSAYTNWWSRRHDWNINKEWLIFCTGVIPAITTAVNRITNVGDNVVVQTPVYNTFYNSIENHGRHVVENELIYENGQYRMDYEDLEKKLEQPLTTMMILCNPHNPAGRIWSKDELEKVGQLCARHHVVVLSDEIHCDITLPGKEYNPYAAVSAVCADNCIVCIAPTKTFNMAGMQTAAVVIPNEAIRARMDRGLNSYEVAEPNIFACEAAIAAFTKGEAWLEELRQYLADNRSIAANYFQKEIPQLKLVEAEATYLLWVDCSDITNDTKELCRRIREKTGLYISNGSQYRGGGRSFVRINIACPRTTLMDGLSRLKEIFM